MDRSTGSRKIPSAANAKSKPRKAQKAVKKKRSQSSPWVAVSSPQTIRAVLKRLAKAYPEATCALEFRNPLELLVATILSAQCTDARVNQVTHDLFRKYKTPSDFAQSPPGVLEEEIRSTGFFNNKAKSIRGAAQAIEDRFSGKIPKNMDELLTLPGVARKTANVVLGTAFGIPSGIVVDTHVTRLSQRLGLTEEKIPEKIEADLMEKIPQSEWIAFGHRLILHGRRICKSRNPACPECPLSKLCPSSGNISAA